jgi:dihydroflavonol-4-reductase
MSSAPRTVVTGAAGFIGAHLARRLADAGAEVEAVDVRPCPPQLNHPGIRYSVADIRDAERLGELLPGADTVFHLASVHLDVHADVDAFEAVNVRAAEQLVSLCAAAGVRRLVHTSSVGVFGHVSHPPAAEDAPKRPGSPYERTKLAGEVAVVNRASRVGLDTIVLRPAWVYGPGCPRTEKLLRSIGSGRFFFVGTGSNLRHPLFIGDMLDAFQLARDAQPAADPADPRIYIVAGPAAVTLREMVHAVAAALSVPPPRLRLPRPVAVAAGLASEIAFRPLRRDPPFSRRTLAFFENDNAFSTAAIEGDLGFTARVGLEEGLRRTLQDTQWRRAR